MQARRTSHNDSWNLENDDKQSEEGKKINQLYIQGDTIFMWFNIQMPVNIHGRDDQEKFLLRKWNTKGCEKTFTTQVLMHPNLCHSLTQDLETLFLF
jgi:hypothetical protein